MKVKTSPSGAPPDRTRTARSKEASSRSSICARRPAVFAGERRKTRAIRRTLSSLLHFEVPLLLPVLADGDLLAFLLGGHPGRRALVGVGGDLDRLLLTLARAGRVLLHHRSGGW